MLHPSVGVLVRRLVFLVLAVLIIPLPAAASELAEAPLDYAIPGGHFYLQTGSGKGGFGVRDIAGVKFWTEYQRFGGPDTLGFPISRPFWGPGGFLYQAFQRGLLQWHPRAGEAVLANNIEIIEWHDRTHDLWLFHSHFIPYPRQPRRGIFGDEVTERLSWLTNPELKRAFLSDPRTGEEWSLEEAMGYYGLPQSEPQRFGPFVVQRFQRIPLQLWVQPVAGMPSPGSVVGVLSGELVKDCGAIPMDATFPEPPVPSLAEVEAAEL